jgi:hypothetical protein
LVDASDLGKLAEHLAHKEWVADGLAIHGVGETHPGLVEGLTGDRLHPSSNVG